MKDGIDFPGHATKATLQSLDIHAFDAAAGRWTRDEKPPSGKGIALARLTCVTFNAWFQGGDRELRYAGLSQQLERSDADVIMLQECTTQLLEVLMKADWVRGGYRFVRAPFRADAIPSHGLMLLSRLPFANAKLHPIPTHMGRSLLTVETRLNGASVVFATVHLESMKPNADTRGEQLQEIFAILERRCDVVLAGDFNFCSSWPEENKRLDPRYIDTWARLRPNEPGFTQDTVVNGMLARAKGQARQVRIDRLLLRSDTAEWMPESIRLLGTAPVDANPQVFPSDHFGLAATMRYRAPA